MEYWSNINNIYKYVHNPWMFKRGQRWPYSDSDTFGAFAYVVKSKSSVKYLDNGRYPEFTLKEKLTNIAITTYKSQANERIGLMRMNWMMITTRVRGSGWSPPCWSGCPRCRSGGRWPGGSCPSSQWTRGRSRCGCPTCLRTPPSHLNMKKNELPDDMSQKSCKKIHLAQKTSDQCWLGWRTHQSLKSTIYPGVGQGSLGESA